jgi:hypothetical protein
MFGGHLELPWLFDRSIEKSGDLQSLIVSDLDLHLTGRARHHDRRDPIVVRHPDLPVPDRRHNRASNEDRSMYRTVSIYVKNLER